jgi:hypothetical protein
MRVQFPLRLAAPGILLAGLACAGNTAKTEDETAAARDTTQVKNPPGYAGMERDTTQVPPGATEAPVDTFLQRQGTGAPQDTMGYSGIERDTTHNPVPAPGQVDSTQAAPADSRMGAPQSTDTSGAQPSNPQPADSTPR